ncbi:MAG: hypothetical protein AB1781_10740 [Pseudomonadota bacterium]
MPNEPSVALPDFAALFLAIGPLDTPPIGQPAAGEDDEEDGRASGLSDATHRSAETVASAGPIPPSAADFAFGSTFAIPPEAEFLAEIGAVEGPGSFLIATPSRDFLPAAPIVTPPPVPPPVPLGLTRIGGNGDDLFTGTNLQDFLFGEAEDDRLEGLGGSDWLEGGNGSDRLFGGAGSDQLFGGPGDDFLDGGPGDDFLSGGFGDDTYFLDDPGDTAFEALPGLSGGFDTAVAGDPLIAAIGAGSAPATFVFAGGALGGKSPVDAGHLFFVDNNIEALRLEGGLAANAIGNADPNTITGNEGANTLWGGDGDDFLFGMGGNDTLAGGNGDDFLAGGDGDDIYLFYGDETGFDVVQDISGVNFARLLGFTSTTEALGVVDGAGDLTLFVHDTAAPFVLFRSLFRVDGYAGNPGSFAGVELAGFFFATDDLVV